MAWIDVCFKDVISSGNFAFEAKVCEVCKVEYDGVGISGCDVYRCIQLGGFASACFVGDSSLSLEFSAGGVGGICKAGIDGYIKFAVA